MISILAGAPSSQAAPRRSATPLPSKLRCDLALAILTAPRKYTMPACWKGVRERPSFPETVRGKCLAEHGGKIVVAVSGLPFMKDDECVNDRFVIVGTHGAPEPTEVSEVLELSLNGTGSKLQYSMRVSAQGRDGGLGATKMCGADEGAAVVSGESVRVDSQVTRVEIAGECPAREK